MMVKITQEAIKLWALQLVPALFPYMIISSFILTLLNRYLPIFDRFLSKISYRIFHLSVNGLFILISSHLCGYPIGAKLISESLENHHISEEECNYLLTICNQASPAFLQHYISIVILDSLTPNQSIIIVFYLSTYITSLITKIIYPHNLEHIKNADINTSNYIDISYINILDNCIIGACSSIFKIGGYIIMFSLISNFLLSYIPSTCTWLIIIISCLEITTGLSTIHALYFNKIWYVYLVLSITAFGGFSTMAQIKGMLSRTSLTMKPYIIGKLIYIPIVLCTFFLFSKIKIFNFFI